MNNPVRVAVLIPSQDQVHADFAMSLAAFTYNPGAVLALINMKGSLVQVLRDNGVRQAQELGVDYVFFLDSDMVFPQGTLKRLLSHGKDIVGATYSRRAPPYVPIGIQLTDEAMCSDDGVHEVAGLPTGCLLIKTSVFDKLKRPYFRCVATEETDDHGPLTLGEDYYFCQAAREAGFSVWLDVGLSYELGHIGQTVFRISQDAQKGKAA